jgi:hypothetical protein
MAKLYPSDVWRMGDSLDPMEKLVALALLDYGDRIFPSQAHVAVKTGLSLATVKRVMRSLRAKLVVSVKRNRKGLSYAFVMAQPDTSDGVSLTPQKCQPDTGSVSHRATNYPKNYPTNQSGPPEGGRGGVVALSEDIRSAIAMRDPRGNVDAQHRVVSRMLGEHGVIGNAAQEAWIALARNWARTGNGAYETLAEMLTSMVEVRDPAAVLMYRIRRLAA